MSVNRLKKLVLVLGGWLAIIAFLSAANARYYLVYYFLQSTPLNPGGIYLSRPRTFDGSLGNYDLNARVDADGSLRFVVGECFRATPRDQELPGDLLHNVRTWRNSEYPFQAKIEYGQADDFKCFTLRSGRRVQRGSLAYVRLTPGFSTAQEESMVLVTLSAGQPASPRKYIITAHLSRFVPPLLAEPPVGAEDGR